MMMMMMMMTTVNYIPMISETSANVQRWTETRAMDMRLEITLYKCFIVSDCGSCKLQLFSNQVSVNPINFFF